jgi:hypothetical protein
MTPAISASWKTSIFGLFALVGGVIQVTSKTPWLCDTSALLVAIGVAGVGVTARDVDKTASQISWKTTAAGILSLIGGVLQVSAGPDWLHALGGLMVAVGVAGVGLAARDANKASSIPTASMSLPPAAPR